MTKDRFDEEALPQQPADLGTTLARLQAVGEGVVNAEIIYGLNGLATGGVRDLWLVWQQLDADLRRRVIEALIEAAETNFELEFLTVGRMALDDPSPEVRSLAIELLWEDESFDVMLALLRLLREDTENEVRATAASALGRFALMGEMGGLNPNDFRDIQETLLTIVEDPSEDLDVRRRALEAVANCTHEAIEEAIQEAYQSDEQHMRVSALFAMGRTADIRWASIVLDELESDDAELRFEAARAAGELELEEAVPVLSQIAFDDDVEIRDAAVWSLGEIGGREALRVLNLLAEEAKQHENEDFLGAVEDAIAAATMGADSAMYMLRMDDEE